MESNTEKNQALPYTLHIDGQITIGGIARVLVSTEREVRLRLREGHMELYGTAFNIIRLDTAQGTLHMTGKLSRIVFNNTPRGAFSLKKLFK